MNTDSQRIKIQRWLATGANLTPLMALQKFGCMSLSQRIGELRRQRWPILTTMVKRGRSRFASYRIDRSKS
jgi:hypothetical protein